MNYIKKLFTVRNMPNILQNHQIIRNLNSLSASITKTHRLKYARAYPTVIVNPDGSTFNIKYHEPRKIIKLPLDLSTLTEAERKARLDKRKAKKRIKIEEDIGDRFDSRKYLKYIKKK